MSAPRCKKAGFASRRAAEDRMVAIQRGEAVGPLPYAPVRAYRCPSCRRYHLTSNPQKWRN